MSLICTTCGLNVENCKCETKERSPVERGVISPPLLMAMIRNFMGKVNRVTSQHRHGLKVSDIALTKLSNKQIELEELMDDLGI